VPPAIAVPAPFPRGFRYVLVKFPAQKTHSVDFQHQDINPGCPGPQPEPTNPCAAVLCPTGHTCVVLESFPPQAQCVPAPAPDRCTSSQTCPRGTRCSTERGDCQGCGAGPGVACPAVCFGVCEPASTGVCTGGVIMGGGCRTAESFKSEADRLCRSNKLVLTDFGVGNACFAGGFESAKYTCCSPDPTPPPPPPPVCKVDSDCRLVSNTCGQKPCTCGAAGVNQPMDACLPPPVMCLVDPCANQVAACVNGQCQLQPQPAPPPACEWAYRGGANTCKTYDQWKSEASAACQSSGRQLTQLSTGSRCTGDSYTEIKFECCAVKR
jgi:hypothetical protein